LEVSDLDDLSSSTNGPSSVLRIQDMNSEDTVLLAVILQHWNPRKCARVCTYYTRSLTRIGDSDIVHQHSLNNSCRVWMGLPHSPQLWLAGSASSDPQTSRVYVIV